MRALRVPGVLKFPPGMSWTIGTPGPQHSSSCSTFRSCTAHLGDVPSVLAATVYPRADRHLLIDDEVLALETTMLNIGYELGARSLGEEVLYYAEDIPFYDDAQLNVTSQSCDARRLEAACPPDDTISMPIDALDHYFTISAFGHSAEPIAGAGYDVFSDTVGQLLVLVAASQRGKGYGTFMLARAAEECMFDGLLPQFVTPVGDEIGEKMANDVGFLLSGFRTSVTFD